MSIEKQKFNRLQKHPQFRYVKLEAYKDRFQLDSEDQRSLLHFQQASNRDSIDQLQIHFTRRMTQAIPKRHSKRCCGITAAMRQNILREAQSGRYELIDQMMAELNKSPKKSPRSPLGNRPKGNNILYSSGSSQQNGLDGNYKSSNMQPVNRDLPEKIKISNPSLKDVLQAGKMHLRGNNSPSKSKKCIDAQTPQPLSKKSTGYSTQSEQEVLKEENEKFKQMVALQIERVLKLQRQIENQTKVQQLRKQLYEESIKRLQRVADADVFSNDNEDGNHLEDSCENCGVLSIMSR